MRSRLLEGVRVMLIGVDFFGSMAGRLRAGAFDVRCGDSRKVLNRRALVRIAIGATGHQKWAAIKIVPPLVI